MTYKDILPGLSRTKVIFQDFPGPAVFKKKIQDFLGGVGTLNSYYSIRCSFLESKPRWLNIKHQSSETFPEENF